MASRDHGPRSLCRRYLAWASGSSNPRCAAGRFDSAAPPLDPLPCLVAGYKLGQFVQACEGELLLSLRQHELESNVSLSASAHLRRSLAETDIVVDGDDVVVRWVESPASHPADRPISGWACSLLSHVEAAVALSMKRLFSHRRRAGDERRSRNSGGRSAQTHPLFSKALDQLPHARWAVACNAEFRAEGVTGLRGILHHDGAILRFTTWGNTERFVGAPMEFSWELSPNGEIHVISRGTSAWFSRLAPLSSFVEHPPSFAAANDEPLAEALAAWMRTWAPVQSPPLASRM